MGAFRILGTIIHSLGRKGAERMDPGACSQSGAAKDCTRFREAHMSAKVTITRAFDDGDGLCVCVKVDTSYPDAVNEAMRVACDAYAEALALTVVSTEEPDA